jgi:energy-coupling factor transport system permease protein
MTLDLDPRTRLLLALMYAVLIIVSGRTAWLVGELVLLLLVILAVGQGPQYMRWLRLVGAMTVTWFAVSWWAFDVGTAVMASLRLVTLTSAFFLFFRTTAPEALGDALVKSGLPYEVAFVLSASLQFAPVISRKAQNIFDAQRSRGIPLKPGLAALRHYPALMAPLLVQAFQLADELAEAMEARGFGRPGRTFMHDYRMRMMDWMVLGVAAVALSIVIAIR